MSDKLQSITLNVSVGESQCDCQRGVTMSKGQRSLLPDDDTPRRITKGETFAAVQSAFIAILKQRGKATADALREYLDIPPAGLPAIGRAIADLARQRKIEEIAFTLSERPKAHARPLRIWQLAKEESPTNGQR
jgi:hypothetical protein